MTDRVPGAPGQHKAIIAAEELQKLQAGEEFAITLRRDDQPVLEGTPYSKAAVLPDEVAAKLCPNVEDPAPKDAFKALAEGKSDGIQKRTGVDITLSNAAHTPVKGLKLFGKTTEDGSVGDSGSVAVTVAGKNIFNHQDTEKGQSAIKILETGDNYIIAQGIGTTGVAQASCGYLYYNKTAKIPCKKDVSYAISVAYTFLEDPYRPENPSAASTRCPQIIIEDTAVLTQTSSKNWSRFSVGKTQRLTAIFKANKDGEFYITIPLMSATVKIENLMVEIGTAATDFEPYREVQTLTVPIPCSLKSEGSLRDEIDFARGVYIQCVGVAAPVETALPTEVMDAYGVLHTYQPSTRIYNDAGTDMEVVYYTPSTAVQMVHSPVDAGKVLAVDQHGCVTLSNHGIVEAGISGDWYYRKWADGFAECWGTFTETLTGRALDIAAGVPGYTFVNLPFEISKVYSTECTVTMALSNADYSTMSMESHQLRSVYVNEVNHRVELCVTCPANCSDDARKVLKGNLHIAGTWK